MFVAVELGYHNDEQYEDGENYEWNLNREGRIIDDLKKNGDAHSRRTS